MTIQTILAGRDGTVHSARGDERVGAVVERLNDLHIGAVPVIADGEVVGIFSERDVIHCLKSHGAAALDLDIASVMTSPVVTITSDTPALSALSLMTQRRIRHLPVVDGSGLAGFVSIGDLVKYRIDRIEAEAAAMRDYISGA